MGETFLIIVIEMAFVDVGVSYYESMSMLQKTRGCLVTYEDTLGEVIRRLEQARGFSELLEAF